MWKLFFEFMYFLTYFIPSKKLRSWVRTEKLFDYKTKLNALKSNCPELNFKTIRLAKGGGSLAFIIENKIVFKVRKHNDEATIIFPRFEREKRITDALRPYCPIMIPQIELVRIGKFIFYKTVFIPGKILINMPFNKIIKNQNKIAKQLANVIFNIFNSNPKEIADLAGNNVNKPGHGWINGDMCSNILVNPKTMDITGIIDWEWARYGLLKDEFFGIYRVRKKMTKTKIPELVEKEYLKLL